jgi:hypothetical protein
MATPLKQTPKVVSQGSVSKPKAQPGVKFQGPLLPTPTSKSPSKLARPSGS